MDRQPVFTVIIPTYNREHFLKRTVDSILSQTFKDFELIIVDDGSTDHTKDLIDTYEDDRIVYFYKENGGQNSAVNVGLQKARGEYIAFCDSDDTWMPEKLEKCMEKYQEDKEVKVVYTWTGIIKTVEGVQKIEAVRDDSCEGWCYKEVIEQGYLTSPSFLTCKKECFDVIGLLPTDVFLCQDDDLCFRLCKHFKVGLVREILGVYNFDAPGRIMSHKKRCADDYVKFLDKWSNEIVEVCGNGLLVKRYIQASWYYMEIDEVNLAKDTYGHACELEGRSLEEVRNELTRDLHVDEEIIIYGTGYWGKKTYRMLKMLGFQKFIFVVTHAAQTEEAWEEIPIKGIGEMGFYKEESMIIASSDYYDEMRKTAEEKGFYKIISYMQIKNMIFDREDL